MTDGEVVATAVRSVKKIRKFRLSPRPSSILRNLKSLLDPPQVTPELEKAVETEVLAARTLLDTAALYDTLTPVHAPSWMTPLWTPVSGEKKAVAFTIFISTIGSAFESELADALSRGELLRSRILTAIGEELAEQSANFIERLVAEEARQESCELEERRTFSNPEDIRSALGLLDAGRLAISYDAAGHLSPRFTLVGAIPWGPPAKKKK